MKCINCQKEAGEKYRVNQLGDVFCDDFCYQDYARKSDRSNRDKGHPYIRTYEYVRSQYIYWLENWKAELQASNNKKMKAEELEMELDQLIEDYMGFCITEEEEGIFGREISLYVKKLKAVREKIQDYRTGI